VKNLLRNWLGVDEIEQKQAAINAGSPEHDYLTEICMLSQKIDAIAEAIGVVVVADISTGSGVAVVTRDESRLHEAQVMSDYAVAAKEMLNVQINSLRATQFLIDSFNKRHTHLNGHLNLKRFSVEVDKK
jgi:hypothetical protein